MKSLVIVSTRPPSYPMSGGMAPAMREVAALYGKTIWYGLTNGEDARGGKRKKTPPGHVKRYTVESINVRELSLSTGNWHSHANEFINQTVWPDMHGMSALSKQFAWADYRGHIATNKILANRISRDLKGDSDIPVFVQDNHHLVLPRLLREEGVKNPIVVFDHTPVRDPATMTPPMRAFYEEHIFRPLLCADAANFQTAENARRFMQFLGIDDPPMLAAYNTQAIDCRNGHKLLVGHFPISINTAKIMETAKNHALTDKGSALAAKLVAPYVFINFERADYTKDLSTRLAAFKLLLERHPELRGKVQLTACAEPSRTDIEAYRTVAAKAKAQANEMNSLYADAWIGDHPPVIFLNESFLHDDCIRLMRSDENCRKIGCVTPYADGMNLVSKEFAAAQDIQCAGPLILSRDAGAAYELGRSALLFAPGNVEQLYQQMLASIHMSQPESNNRCRAMQDHLKTFDIGRWGREHDRLFRKIAAGQDEHDLIVPTVWQSRELRPVLVA